MSTKAFLNIKRYPNADDDWEEKDQVDRTWKN
jgi:hypothetical protein